MSDQLKEERWRPLSEKILNLVREEMQADRRLTGGEVAFAVMTVLVGYVAAWRVKGKSMEEMADWLAFTIHKKYIDAHIYMASDEAKKMPGG